jgi:hypothetical protein
MENVEIFNDHLVCILCGHFLYFMEFGIFCCKSPFWYLVSRKIWQPCVSSTSGLLVVTSFPFFHSFFAPSFAKKM